MERSRIFVVVLGLGVWIAGAAAASGRDLAVAGVEPARAHSLEIEYTPEGISVTPRGAEAATWRWGLRLAGWGREGDLRAPPAAELVARGRRVEYRRDGIVEWYLEDERGLEQGFTIVARPPGDAPLTLSLAITGTLRAAVRDDGQRVDFQTAAGVCVVRYDHLVVLDARGVPLPASIELDGDRLSIVVDDAGATYPVTIDPLATSPSWSVEGGQTSWLGASVSTAGDVNGDGFFDVIVGAPIYTNGESGEGRALVYHGGPSGLETTSAWAVESDNAGARFGESVSTAGDVNGDGYSDVIVGAPFFSNGEHEEGAAYVFHGGSSGLSTTAAWMVESNHVHTWYGYSVSVAGDVDADGFLDVIVGEMRYGQHPLFAGRAYVYLGGTSGLATDPAWIAQGSVSGALGSSVSTAGDVNGDGYSDVAVGAPWLENGNPYEGRASVYHGGPAGLATTPSWSAEGNTTNLTFGEPVSTAGDVNGDGYSDLIVGAQIVGVHDGRAFVFHGGASGLEATASWTVVGDSDSKFGAAATTAGDIDGDGYADVVIGAPEFDAGQTDEGGAFLYRGGPAGLETEPSWEVESDKSGAFYGASAATAGDVDGDGYADVIVGAPRYSNGESQEGLAFLYRGGPSAPSEEPDWTRAASQANARLGGAVASAGDVNGDGFADVLVGAPGYDTVKVDAGRVYQIDGGPDGLSTSAAWAAESEEAGSGLGLALSTAGDVNGDGYADVILGEPFPGGGAAYVIHGGPSGLALSVAWVGASEQTDAEFARSVATAGDVNGDGYLDVIVGAPRFDDDQVDEGRAYVFHGGPAGLSITESWTTESDQPNARLGGSVATAGDVNGDGYADVIVSAHLFDAQFNDQGRVWVFHGGPSGLSTTADWHTEPYTSGLAGLPVSSAGDVNGDGYADVVLGTPFGEGTVFVHLGGPSGLTSAPPWEALGIADSGRFGQSVGSGDVDGDGYSDVIVGAPLALVDTVGEGAAYIHLGGPSGLSVNHAWMAEGDQYEAWFGWSVAGAGDVDGDGCSDVIVGAPSYGTGAPYDGRADLFSGNDGPGVGLGLRPRQADDSAPIARLGAAKNAAFRLDAVGRSPFGRSLVKLEVEAKPLGTPFDGTGTTQTPTWTDTGTAGVALSEPVGGLALDTVHHWRARFLYEPAASPFQASGRWFTRPRGGAEEGDLRTEVAATPASATGYGSGKSGTHGVPSLTGGAPVLGQTVDLTIGDGLPSVAGLLFAGTSSASIPFDGGALLVTPLYIVTIPLDGTGQRTLPVPLPTHASLDGVDAYFQFMFIDPGASGFHRSAQTPGLHWVLGHAP